VSAPVLTHNHGRYTVTWDGDEPIELEFGFLRSSRREGEVTAELKVSSKMPGYSGLLHRAKLTLGSTRSQAEFAKHLDTRTKGSEIDWVGKIGEGSILVLDAHREGDPAILIRDAVAPIDSGFVLPPFLLGHHPTILFGDGGAMKSMTALAAAISMHAFLDTLGIEPAQRVRCGVFDWEFEAYEHNQRMRAMLGPGADLPDIPYLRMVGPLSDNIERAERFIADHNLTYGVFDSVGLACDGPPEEAQAALGYYGALRVLNIGSLTIAHTNRTQDDSRPFGSTFHHNSARMTWFVRKQAEVGVSTVDIGLWNKKSNTTVLQPPLGFRFHFDGDQIAIKRTDVRDVEGFAAQIPLKDRIARVVESGARTYDEIADALPDEKRVSIESKVRAYANKVFTVMPGIDGKKRIGLISHTQPDNEEGSSWPSVTALEQEGLS
jgi:hypothetical protein